MINQGYVYNGTTGTGVTNGAASGSFTSISFPVYDNDDNTNQAFVVHFKSPAQTTTYHQGVEESKTIQRTINYYDKVTGARIPSSLIAQNPTTDSVTFTRTQVLDQMVRLSVTVLLAAMVNHLELKIGTLLKA